MKLVYKSYMIKNESEFKEELVVARKIADKESNGWVQVNGKSNLEIEVDIPNGCLTREERKFIYELAQKYSGLDFSHRINEAL